MGRLKEYHAGLFFIIRSRQNMPMALLIDIGRLYISCTLSCFQLIWQFYCHPAGTEAGDSPDAAFYVEIKYWSVSDGLPCLCRQLCHIGNASGGYLNVRLGLTVDFRHTRQVHADGDIRPVHHKRQVLDIFVDDLFL